jgi:glycosyltransferase involved in cell wall biosynthesis
MRVLSIVEGGWVTGPIKPLLMFARLARQPDAAGRSADVSLAVTVRGHADATASNELVQAVRAAGLSIDPIREKRAWDPSVVFRYAELVKRTRPDVVETHQVKCHFILGLALKLGLLKRNFRWIAFHHGYTRASAKLSAYEALDRWSLRLPDHVVTFCRPFRDELHGRGVPAGRVSVIPNVIDRPVDPAPDQVAALRAEFGARDDDLIVLSVGRLSPEKGHAHLVDAMHLVGQDAALSGRALLVLVGEGPERRNLEDRAATLGVRAVFAGHRGDVWPCCFSADAFALPSMTEGSPLALIEAMNAGRAIVATQVGGVPELVEDGTSAMLVPPGDPAALAEAIKSLLRSRELRQSLGGGAREAARLLTPEAYRNRLFAIYAAALES